MPGIMAPGYVSTAASVDSALGGGPPGGANNNIPDGILKLKPAVRIKFLIGLGYDLNPKEGWGPRAQAAWKNMLSARTQDIAPQKAAAYWSTHSALSRSFKAPAPDAGGKPAPVAAAAQAPPTQPVVINTAPTSDVASSITGPLNKQSAAFLKQLLGLKTPGMQKVNPQQLVDMLGPNLSEDLLSSLSGENDINKSIDYLKSLVTGNDQATAQRVKDIGAWYGEVGNSLATAASRDKAINAATTAAIQDASKGIISGIGGEANPGSGMAAQAGQQGADLSAALGSANEQYNADIAPLLQMEAAGAKTQAQNAGGQNDVELQKEILNAQTTRDTNLANARLQLAQINSGLDQNRAALMLQGIQANNALGQQGYANRLSKAQSILAAMGFGLNVGQLGATINANAGRVAATNASTVQRATDNALNRAERASEFRSKALNKLAAPPSSSSLREADKAAAQSVAALRQTGQLNGAADIANAINAINSAYGITPMSNLALRTAAYRTAQRILPGVQVSPRWFHLG